ncbi:hypothetical protein E1301_Tti010722 [Triplophysa tibetana]|uniref:Uncharacterized protein n=1 Tax=Triplophysa tibetana TaxID=1572043 RepID=A0A5A9PTE5_9TELE|nr:hypothetical protein E1301_Tti010722 [Triplophysa tibetana]
MEGKRGLYGHPPNEKKPCYGGSGRLGPAERAVGMRESTAVFMCQTQGLDRPKNTYRLLDRPPTPEWWSTCCMSKSSGFDHPSSSFAGMAEVKPLQTRESPVLTQQDYHAQSEFKAHLRTNHHSR